MPTNANTFNSRVTSEALEAKFRQVFPAQGGAELVQDLFASGVIQPVVDFSTVAEGSVLPIPLQQAWDFSTGHNTIQNSSATIINNAGFWKIDLTLGGLTSSGGQNAKIELTDGLTTKPIWEYNLNGGTSNYGNSVTDNTFIVFVRSGDSITATSSSNNTFLDVWYRQIADVNGTLVNPLGFTFS